MAYEHIEIDINEMDLGELAAAEALCGVSITPIITRQDLPATVLMAMATVIVQRTNPAFTYAEASKLKIGRFNEVADIEEVAADLITDPTVPAPDPAPATAPPDPALTS